MTLTKCGEAQIPLLTSEVNHRSRNLLDIVQAIAHLTARRGCDPATFVEQLSQRIDSCGKSGSLGQGRAAEVELAKAQLAHLSESITLGSEQMKEPRVQLLAAAAQGVGRSCMTRHQRGQLWALPNVGGRVRITWRISLGASTPQKNLHS
jgi:two-component sensor histidine kinase